MSQPTTILSFMRDLNKGLIEFQINTKIIDEYDEKLDEKLIEYEKSEIRKNNAGHTPYQIHLLPDLLKL